MEYNEDWDVEWNELIDAYEKESDRSAGLLASSFLDEYLANCIQSVFIDDSSDYPNEKRSPVKGLLSYNGPIGTFGIRIDMAYALGLITDDERDDFHQIRKIRNEFAHSSKPIGFNNSKVKSHCNALKLGKEFANGTVILEFDDTDLRLKFLRTISLLHVLVHNRRVGIKPFKAATKHPDKSKMKRIKVSSLETKNQDNSTAK